MTTTVEMAVNANRQAADALARTAKAMPDDKQTWKPLDEGRSALDQVVECGGGMNLFMSRILQNRALPEMNPREHERMVAENDTMEKALALLEKGTVALLSAIESFPKEHLGDTIRLPFGGGMDRTFEEVMFMPYWNMTYHTGQINYIQTLYGDREMH